jgi:hypothetical protein
VGIRGRSGALIDQVALKCRPASCFFTTGTCAGDYYTDEFGGTGGASFEQTCTANRVLTGIRGFASSSLLYSMGGICAPLTNVDAGDAHAHRIFLAVQGDQTSGTGYASECDDSSLVTGFQARTSDKRFVTGLKPICRPAGTKYTSYVGGFGGGQTADVCPVGNVAVGTVQRIEQGVVNIFGIACAPQGLVVAGLFIPGSEITVVHTGYMYFGQWFGVPNMVERVATAHLPSDYTITHCGTGHALTGVSVFHDNVINQIANITCRDIRANGSQTKTVDVNQGTATGSSNAANCPSPMVADGLLARQGWLNDGFALHCRNP